jgi:hypothetical protein
VDGEGYTEEMAILFSYVLRPGSVFFLGYDSNYDRINDNIFVKFSFGWRI